MMVAWFYSGDGGHHFKRFWYPMGTSDATLDPVSGKLAFRYTGIELPRPDQLQRTKNGGTTFVSIGHLPFNTGICVRVVFRNADSGYATKRLGRGHHDAFSLAASRRTGSPRHGQRWQELAHHSQQRREPGLRF
ncbi:MAG: hypothetical protein ABSG36_07505 [Acidimicrobiales bacterium]|jgi:hypothetical protein